MDDRVFFCHASENIDAVDLYYRALIASYPEHQPWLDKYEIVGGDDLVDKISEGMDASTRFFVFLSRIAMTKPWVNAELQRAIMRQIVGIDPNYIVPVKLGDLDRVPAFLEHKRYIDVTRLTKDQVVAEFHAAITGVPLLPNDEGSSNLRVTIEAEPGQPNVASVRFEVVAWAERFGFGVRTNADIRGAMVTEVPKGGIAMNSFRGVQRTTGENPRYFGRSIADPMIRPGEPLIMRVAFDPGVDGQAAIVEITRFP